MRKDYYRVLDIGADADAESIRAAYLKMAKTHHPDRAGQHETALFQEIREAYDVLSDPEKKKRYDAECRARVEHRGACRPAAVRPEPLIPLRPRRRRSHFQEIFDAVLSRAAWESDPAEEFNLRLHLTEHEASRGCLLNFEVAIPRVCSICAGSGRVWPGRCRGCRGTGRFYETHRLRLRVPQGTEDGTVMEAPLVDAHGPGGRVRFHIRIGRTRL